VGYSIQNPGQSYNEYEGPCGRRDALSRMRSENSVYLGQHSERANHTYDERQLIQKDNVGRFRMKAMFAGPFVFMP